MATVPWKATATAASAKKILYEISAGNFVGWLSPEKALVIGCDERPVTLLRVPHRLR
jgi:hypothetical protein